MFTRLKDLREDNDFTQTDLAKRLNCSQRIYSNYERGDVSLPIDILIKLALLYDVSTDYILNLTDEPTAPNRKKL